MFTEFGRLTLEESVFTELVGKHCRAFGASSYRVGLAVSVFSFMHSADFGFYLFGLYAADSDYLL
jgi:hypothetical protein